MAKIRRILTVDERSRITLGTALVEPGNQFVATKGPDGIITLHPVEVDIRGARS